MSKNKQTSSQNNLFNYFRPKANVAKSEVSSPDPKISQEFRINDDGEPSRKTTSDSIFHYLVHGVVHHSFSLNEKPLHPWILVRTEGCILAAHCNCAIGILEACSHVGATLFALDGIRNAITEKKLSVTDLPAYWKTPPTSITTDLYKKVRDIDFGRKIRRIHPCRRSDSSSGTRQVALLEAIQKDNLNVAAVMQFCGEADFNFKCSTCAENDRIAEGLESYNLRSLFQQLYSSENLPNLRRIADDVYRNLRRDPEKLKAIESVTQEQSHCKWWLFFRSGRITASILKEVCHTSILKPSITLIRKICYPEIVEFSTPATRYGKKHEDEAVNELYYAVSELHNNLTIEKCGLIISNEEPCLGATPDAIFRCTCHGTIVIEVKCPYTARNCEDISILTQLKDPYVIKSSGGEILLNTKHKYFLQSLMQVHICNANFGYFCVWSPKQKYIFEVKRNEELWNFHKAKATRFFKQVILPELMSKCYTRTTN
ncbi:uncharacterized protein LOC134209411 [Armigeres subalbatus]|uniref:uncharacterized protein LOC134209411 n=1 Tax=Armigeres subalbatus TaxID=124917 RepID=UPI002ED0F13B